MLATSLTVPSASEQYRIELRVKVRHQISDEVGNMQRKKVGHGKKIRLRQGLSSAKVLTLMLPEGHNSP